MARLSDTAPWAPLTVISTGRTELALRATQLRLQTCHPRAQCVFIRFTHEQDLTETLIPSVSKLDLGLERPCRQVSRCRAARSWEMVRFGPGAAGGGGPTSGAGSGPKS